MVFFKPNCIPKGEYVKNRQKEELGTNRNPIFRVSVFSSCSSFDNIRADDNYPPYGQPIFNSVNSKYRLVNIIVNKNMVTFTIAHAQSK